MFGALYVAEGSAIDALLNVAREFSPRIEIGGPRAFDAAGAFDGAQARQVVLDLSGLTRLFGDARAMGEALLRIAADRGLRVRVAIAGTRTAARLLACAAGGPLTVVDPGTEAAALAPLPIDLLAVLAHDEPVSPSHPRTLAPSHPRDARRTIASSHVAVLSTFRRWGLRTLGEVAALPADAVAARLGPEGVRWQRLARGEDPRPLLPVVPEERFEQAFDLEWPIEGLEPLSFVLGRLMEPLSAHLERRGRGAAVLHVRLHLVTRAVHERSLQLPAPMRDARTLRTLALLDLESHPPAAAIDRVVVAVDPTPARVLQFSLLTRPLPSPEQLSTLMARLTALMGEGRCGSPAAVDSWQPGAFAMKPFNPGSVAPGTVAPSDAPSHPRTLALRTSDPAVALRRFRFPVPARVRVDQHAPARVTTDRVAMRPDDPVPAKRSAFADRGGLSGGRVEMCAGPWRTSGNWWTDGPHKAGSLRASVSPWPVRVWDRDEWDVTLSDGATYRIFRDRRTDAWFIEGIVD
jgi:protein ImuB